jgi:hypothetical protein
MKVYETADEHSQDNCGVPNYLTFYEVQGREALQSDAYTKAPQNKRSAGGGGGMFRLLLRHTYVEVVE